MIKLYERPVSCNSFTMTDVPSVKRTLSQICVFCFLYLVTNFVNKYVLSVLDFKYPTIFQGWQTLVGFIVLRMAVVTKHLPAMLTEETKRQEAVRWIPGMVMFVAMIYSGSKALANLTVPVFFSLQNLVMVMSCTAQMALTRQLMSFYSYTMLMLVVVSSVATVRTDPQFNKDGYFWMCIHILATGVLQIYTKLMKGRLKLSSHERLYCSYIYSIILLAPSSYLIGDALEAIRYPYLYFSKFYLGCIFSGVFGVLLNLYTIRLQESYTDTVYFTRLQGLTKIICSVVSLAYFDMTVTSSHAMWLTVNQLAGLVCEDPMLPTAKTTIHLSSCKTEDLQNNPKSYTASEQKSTNGMVCYDIEQINIPISNNVNVFPDSPLSPRPSSRLNPGAKHNVLFEDYIRSDDSDTV